MGEFSVWHWLIVAVVVVVLFGSKRLPDAARSIGRSLRIFKSEMREFSDDREHADPAPARPGLLEAGTAGTGDVPSGRPAGERPDQPGAQPPGAPAE
jgi:sec-independent protein translocase protein TatA